MPITSSFFEQLFSEREFQDQMTEWSEIPDHPVYFIPAAVEKESTALPRDLKEPLVKYGLQCNLFPQNHQRRLSDQILKESLEAVLNAFKTLQVKKSKLPLVENEIALWKKEMEQFIKKNSMDSIYNDKTLSDSERKKAISKSYHTFKTYVQNDFMPNIYLALRRQPEYQNKSQRELSKILAEEEAFNLSFRPGILNVTPGDGCMEFTADLPFAFSRAVPKPSNATSSTAEQQEVYTLSAMLQHLELANFSLHCTGHITPAGKVVVESETIRTASPYPIEGKSLSDQQIQLRTNLEALFKKLGFMRLQAMKTEDLGKGNDEANPICIKLDVIALLSMMQGWIADLDADKQFDISTYVMHMLMHMQCNTYKFPYGKDEKYFIFEPKVFPVGINAARIIPGGAQERYLTHSLNATFDDLTTFFNQNKFNLDKLKPIRSKLNEILSLDESDPAIKALIEQKNTSWKALQLKYRDDFPSDTKALRAYFRELDVLWKKHQKNEHGIFELRRKKFLEAKHVLQPLLENLRVSIYGEFAKNAPELYKIEKQFYNSAQAFLIIFELIGQRSYGLRKFRLQSGMLPALLWYLSQQQEHVTHEFCLRGIDRTGVMLMLEKVLEETTRDSGMFHFDNFDSLISKLRTQQHVDTALDISTFNRGTPGNKTGGGFPLDSGLQLSAKLFRVRYPDLKPTRSERLARMLYFVKQDRDCMADTAWRGITDINVLWLAPSMILNKTFSLIAAGLIGIGRRCSADFSAVIQEEEARAEQETQQRSTLEKKSLSIASDSEVPRKIAEVERRKFLATSGDIRRERSRSFSVLSDILEFTSIKPYSAEAERYTPPAQREALKKMSSYAASSRFFKPDEVSKDMPRRVISLQESAPLDGSWPLASDLHPSSHFPPTPTSTPW